jgi:hypothetical protein
MVSRPLEQDGQRGKHAEEEDRKDAGTLHLLPGMVIRDVAFPNLTQHVSRLMTSSPPDRRGVAACPRCLHP